jgi:tRNA1Val (adenine37-N6)-methyltransferase
MALPPRGELSLDRLTDRWWIYQLKRGHRFSSDDLLTAWMATEEVPEGPRQLDLGAGIGTVGLMCLHRRSERAQLVMVEAQTVSHQLATLTVKQNGLQDRVFLRLGDLRDRATVPEQGVFHLVTGSPPYIPLGKGLVSPHPQRAACRMELRGSIVAYAQTAARAMREDGAFVFCMAAADRRSLQAIEQAGLHLHLRQEVLFRAGREPTIALHLARKTARSGGPEHRAAFVIRDENGEFTSQYHRFRQVMGLVIDRGGPPNERSLSQ